MAPKLSGGIDHVHVSDRRDAEQWGESVLGFRRIVKYPAWAEDDDGPLMVQNPEGAVHLALFETSKPTADTIAFGATAVEFLAWREPLVSCAVEVELTDHYLARSLYFRDPYGNLHEVTTCDTGHVRDRSGQRPR